MVQYYTHSGAKLPYDPWTTHPITVDELKACAKFQGVEFRQADILLIRVGFIQKYYLTTQEEKDRLSNSPETLHVIIYMQLCGDNQFSTKVQELNKLRI